MVNPRHKTAKEQPANTPPPLQNIPVGDVNSIQGVPGRQAQSNILDKSPWDINIHGMYVIAGTLVKLR